MHQRWLRLGMEQVSNKLGHRLVQFHRLVQLRQARENNVDVINRFLLSPTSPLPSAAGS